MYRLPTEEIEDQNIADIPDPANSIVTEARTAPASRRRDRRLKLDLVAGAVKRDARRQSRRETAMTGTALAPATAEKVLGP